MGHAILATCVGTLVVLATLVAIVIGIYITHRVGLWFIKLFGPDAEEEWVTNNLAPTALFAGLFIEAIFFTGYYVGLEILK